MPRKSKKQYSFPVLKRKEIITCMKELQISITEADLKQPHEEKCKLMYASILEKLAGINVLTKQIPYDKLSIFEHPQLHEQSIISVRLICEMIKFMQKVGVHDFNISDLISPESQRTVRNLSAIINFARWQEQKHQIYVEKKSSIQSLDKKLKSITQQNKKLADEFVAINTKMNQEKPEIDKLNAEISELQNQFEFQHQEYQRKGEIAHHIKKEITKLKTTDQEKKIILENKMHEIHVLESKIVKSPQRIKKELKSLSSMIQNEKILISTRNQQLNYDVNKFKQLTLLKQSIQRRCEEMKRIDAIKNEQCVKLESQLKQLQNSKNSIEKELKSNIKKYKVMNMALNNKKAEYAALQQDHETMKQEIQIKNKQINDLKEEHSKKRLLKQTQISSLEKRIEEKKEAIQQLLKQHKHCVQQCAAKYRQLLEAMDSYHQSLHQCVDQW
eukprot:CAMPEP_0197033136 /NCGR_PEP_ID=MMETSP1384-20130603/11626_1 /TAXON_ID=29189 /ORGANISM="Ammonia sp." /LENGTH=443 /DNA_ID=CAMNT_0042462905 /DNA_START=41 /DNA_END=1372 /DNA_ORIENTATION=-